MSPTIEKFAPVYKEQVEGDHTILRIEDGVLFGTYLLDGEVILEKAKAIVKERQYYCAGFAYPFLLDSRNIKKASREARKYWGTAEACSDVKAGALLTDGAVNRILANFYLTLDKPPMPARMFTEEQEALEWLSLYKKGGPKA